MRPKLLLPLLLPLALGGCVDGLGVGTGCEAEMQAVLRAHGPPVRTERGQREAIWFYSSFYFEFTWGAAGEPCRRVGPVSLDLLTPGTLPSLDGSAPRPAAGRTSKPRERRDD